MVRCGVCLQPFQSLTSLMEEVPVTEDAIYRLNPDRHVAKFEQEPVGENLQGRLPSKETAVEDGAEIVEQVTEEPEGDEDDPRAGDLFALATKTVAPKEPASPPGIEPTSSMHSKSGSLFTANATATIEGNKKLLEKAIAPAIQDMPPQAATSGNPLAMFSAGKGARSLLMLHKNTGWKRLDRCRALILPSMVGALSVLLLVQWTIKISQLPPPALTAISLVRESLPSALPSTQVVLRLEINVANPQEQSTVMPGLDIWLFNGQGVAMQYDYLPASVFTDEHAMLGAKQSKSISVWLKPSMSLETINLSLTQGRLR